MVAVHPGLKLDTNPNAINGWYAPDPYVSPSLESSWTCLIWNDLLSVPGDLLDVNSLDRVANTTNLVRFESSVP